MSDPVRQVDGLVSKYLRTGDALPRPSTAPAWSRSGLGGRLVELSGSRATATLTAGFSLVRDAQEEGETTAWITSGDSCFFPPDVADSGVDLNALVIVRVPAQSMLRAADKLARSGALGLILIDLISPSAGDHAPCPNPMQSRLLGLAQKHNTAIVFLTRKPAGQPSLGSLISLRGMAHRTRVGPDRHQVEVSILKDKRRAPGWRHRESCRGPAGLC